MDFCHLPDEVVMNIFSFVPCHYSIREVCHRFNDISCAIKKFKVQFKAHYDENFTKLVDDDEIFQSMMKSQRKIESIEFSSDSTESFEVVGEHKARLQEIIQYFSSNVRLVELSGNVLSHGLLECVSLLSNIEKISLRSVVEMNEINSIKLELNLPKLREITSFSCSENVLRHFSLLPSKALTKLEILSEENCPNYDKNFELFPRQKTLKDIVISRKFLKFVNFQNFKLNSLVLKGPKSPINEAILGQCELTKLVVEGISENELSLICNELKSLKELEITALESKSSEFAELSKLSKLEKLKISMITVDNSTFNESLSFLENRNLKDLDVNSFRNEVSLSTMECLGLNCPKLQKLRITSKSLLDIMNPIINFFPNLVEVSLEGMTEKKDHNFQFKSEAIHKKLNSICLLGINTEVRQLSNLINSIENLEVLKTSMNISHELLRDIFEARPNIKKIYIEATWNTTHKLELTKEFVEVLEQNARNLNTFKALFYSFDRDLNLEELEEKFLKYFSIVHFNNLISGYVECFLCKNQMCTSTTRGKEKIYTCFKNMKSIVVVHES